MLYQYSDYLFPLLIAVGVAFGLLVIFRKLKKLEIEKKLYLRLIVVMSYSGLAFYLGARFFDDLFHFINGEPWGKGGITFIGGMVSAVSVFVILFFIFLKPLRRKFFIILSIIVTGIAIGHAFGRVGCFCAGCCYGKVTDSVIGVHFPGNYYLDENLNIKGTASDGYRHLFNDKLSEYPFFEAVSTNNKSMANFYFDQAKAYADSTKLLPTQLIEVAFLLFLFSILMLIKKYQISIYLIGYGIYRFLAEYLRFDNRGATTFGISPSQLMSILLVVAGVGVLVIYIILSKKKLIDE